MLYVAFLRGINLGSRRSVAMADLRAFAEALAFTRVSTLLNSGNLVFETTGKSGAQLERLLEAECEKYLGLRTEFYVRNATELSTLIKENPFPVEAKKDPSRLVVIFLKQTLAATSVVIPGRERVRVTGRHAFVYYPDGQGRSKLKLPGDGTARNWNTVTKLAMLTASA
ncbi:MAG TPA: DUF1697 domain-containing protein [Gemmatimonadaceae bacterium]|nr:DUF1697 domain-containing protein [Gemmatimonadaceae bacterium]